MNPLKIKLFNFRQSLNIEQPDVIKIVSEHIDLCDKYSEKEIFSSLNNTLDAFKFNESVVNLLADIDTDLSKDALLFNLKDLYSKLSRKENRFLYESALHTLLDCINQSTDDDRKSKILEGLNIYEWIPEIKMFMYEFAQVPVQARQSAKGGKVEDVYSIVLEAGKDTYLAYVQDKWFMMTNEGITATLLEDSIKDDVQLKKLRLLEQAVNRASFSENMISFRIDETLTVSIDTKSKKMLLNGVEVESGSTVESVFNSPVISAFGKGYYPIISETILNLDKFVVLDSVKKVYNVLNVNNECFVFNFKNNIYQYRVDKHTGNSYWKFENAMSIIENVIQEFGADLTFFYENLLSNEIKAKKNLEKQEKQVLESISEIDQAINKIKEEPEIFNENVAVKSVYNSLLTKKHKKSEELKSIRNKKAKLLN